MTTFFLISLAAIGLFVFGFFVGRNNPNIKVVNDLVSAGKVVIDATGKLIKNIKK